MRKLLVLLSLCVVVTFFGAFGFYAGMPPVGPPKTNFTVDGNTVDAAVGSLRLDGAILNLSVDVEQPDPLATATLYLYGAPVQTIMLSQPRKDFLPVVLPTGASEVAVEIRRPLGPFSLSRWYKLRTYSQGAADRGLTISIPQRVWSSRLPITGTAPPRAEITFHLNAEPIKVLQKDWLGNDREEEWIYTDNSGEFSVVAIIPKPGNYSVTLTVSGSNDKSYLGASETRSVEFASELPLIKERRLVVILGDDEIRFQLSATFETGDPRAAVVVNGDLSAAAYVESVFGTVLFDRTIWSNVDVKPLTFITKDDLIEVRQETYSVPIHAMRDGQLDISFSGGEEIGVLEDEIEVRTEGPSLRAFVPLPTSISQGKVIWAATGMAAPRALTIYVDPPPRSGVWPASTPWAIRASDVLPSGLVSLFYDGLAILPMLWLLVLLRDHSPKFTMSHASVLRRSAMTLSTLAVFGTMTTLPQHLTQMLSDVINNSHEFEQIIRHLIPDQYDTYFSQLYHLFTRFLPFFIIIVVTILFRLFFLGRSRTAEIAHDFCIILVRATIWAFLFSVVLELVGRFYDLSGAIEIGVTLGPWIIAFLISSALGYWLLRSLLTSARLLSGRSLKIARGLVAGTAIALLFLVRPNEFQFDPTYDQMNRPFYDAVFAVSRFIVQLGVLAPLLALCLICSALANKNWRLDAKTQTALATLIFAGFLVGTGQVWFVFPVAFLIALFIFPSLVLIGEDRADLLNRHAPEILRYRKAFLSREYEHAKLFAPSNSWFGLGLLGLKNEDQKKKRDYAPLEATVPDGRKIALAELAFALGPSLSPVENGLRALRVGAWGALVFVLIYAVPSFATTDQADRFPYLSALSRAASVGGYWLIGAFFFGYFYSQIRGAAGWKKGAMLAFGIAIAREPFALLAAQSAADYAAIGINVAQRFAFFVLIGLLAFDVITFRKAVGRAVAWRIFPLVAGLSVVEALASIAIAGAGVAASAAFTGQLTAVLSNVATELIPTSNTIPVALQAPAGPSPSPP